MRLLFCCEFYYPSVGGVQEVMRQIAERMVKRGHEVIVATTGLTNRTGKEIHGVVIEEFNIVGNTVRGMKGEVERYRQFVLNINVDAILIKAAQQWTFDALWPILRQIRARKVFIPCGFSGLYEKKYADYFQQLPSVLKCFDHLIFYATRYRDIEYVRAHGIRHFTVIPNGASEIEFAFPRDLSFRARYNILQDSFVFLTVGSLTGTKGHLEVTKAFTELDTRGRAAVLILNGNIPIPPRITSATKNTDNIFLETGSIAPHRSDSIYVAIHEKMKRFLEHIAAITEVLSMRGWSGSVDLILYRIFRKLTNVLPNVAKNMRLQFLSPLSYWIMKANNQSPLKRVLQVDLPRQELIQAYKNADLFVFASNIEYSPLVLFESAAAGTPFLSVPVGNAAEIANWTGCGIMSPAFVDKKGQTKTNVKSFAAEMQKAMDSPELLKKLGYTGQNRWREKFTWAKIVVHYEKILAGDQV
jgi:glycosyltransferase involved in cell wall biosynthesis